MNGAKRLKLLRAALQDETSMKDGRRAPMYIGALKGSGIKVAIVVRNSDQIFRGNAPTLTEAKQAGTLCWMLDANLVSFLRDVNATQYLLTLEKQTGDLWVSRLADWDDLDKLYQLTGNALNRATYRGHANRYMPVHHMIRLPCEISLSATFK